MTDVDPFNPGGSAGFGGSAQDAVDREAEAFLGGGFTSAVWPREGFTVAGTVVEMTMLDQRDLDTNEVVYFVAGSARPVPESKIQPQQRASAKVARQMRMVLQCEPTGVTWKTLQYVETVVVDDDGIRAAYLKGTLQKAVQDAIRLANGKPEIGAYVEITRGKDLPATRKGFSGRHTFTARWTPAAKNARAVQSFMEEPAMAGGGNPFDIPAS